MAPRAYSMERRALAVAETRERILDAATAAYRERGIRATSMQEVARRADVAPGTVRNQFATPEALAGAVLERIMRDLEVPDERVFTGARGRRERIGRLVAALFAFYDRSTTWFLPFRPERDSVPALRAGEARFWSDVEALYASALGPLLDDALFRGIAVGLTSPATLGALRDAGLSTGQAIEVVADLLADRASRTGRRRPRESA